jgi:hypothetical protein
MSKQIFPEIAPVYSCNYSNLQQTQIVYFQLLRVKALGLEPRTYGLKVACPDAENATNQGISDHAAPMVAPRVAPNPTDPDLQRVVEAWPALPEALRRAVLALIGSTAS